MVRGTGVEGEWFCALRVVSIGTIRQMEKVVLQKRPAETLDSVSIASRLEDGKYGNFLEYWENIFLEFGRMSIKVESKFSLPF